jgi:iron(III) transport system substrate-binding protein
MNARSLLSRLAPALLAAVLVLASVGCTGGGQAGNSLTVYSSRAESLVHPLLEKYAQETGVNLRVKYDSSAAIVATLQEEGDNSPADVVYLAESSGLGALSQQSYLSPLPNSLLERVDPRFRSSRGEWIGTSGRSKVVVYNTRTQSPATLPNSVLDYTDPKWRGKIGWAPTHGEWQLLVTALRLQLGEDAARRWIEGIKANEPRTYPNLISIVQGAADGEIEVGFVNHYYVPRFIKERGESFGARNYFLKAGDPGALVDVSGAAILKRSKNQDTAQKFVEYLLSEPAQRYFVEQTFEYPMIKGVHGPEGLPALSELNPPNIDPDQLADLQGTLRLLRSTGVIP